MLHHPCTSRKTSKRTRIETERRMGWWSPLCASRKTSKRTRIETSARSPGNAGNPASRKTSKRTRIETYRYPRERKAGCPSRKTSKRTRIETLRDDGEYMIDALREKHPREQGLKHAAWYAFESDISFEKNIQENKDWNFDVGCLVECPKFFEKNIQENKDWNQNNNDNTL